MPVPPLPETVHPDPRRRRLLGLLGLALGLGPAFGGIARAASATALVPTPSDAEGPFFTPGSPARQSLRQPSAAGTPLVIAGRVRSATGALLTDVKLDFWHTDAGGDYDNRGFRFRGHQYTDAGGRYRLETIVPGAYPGRTRHVHVKVAADGHAPLTTQLYFPGDPRNRGDFLFKPALLLDVAESGQEMLAGFDFVLATT